MTSVSSPPVSGKSILPIGYLIYTRNHASAAPTEQPAGGMRVEFWCRECATPYSGDPAPEHEIPVFRVNIGIYSQVCDACGRLVVDGVKMARGSKVPLCLFGKSAE